MDAGRDGNRLRQLSLATKVKIVASTGFHLQKYYRRDHWLFTAELQKVKELFVRELTEGLTECLNESETVLAGQIKAACPALKQDWPERLMIGAAYAAQITGSAVHVHTEKGSGAEGIVAFFQKAGLDPRRLILAHMDKRIDKKLHKQLIEEGVLLEYDTFSRAKYDPDNRVWPLLFDLLDAGLEDGIAIANDLAYKNEWQAYGGNPGLASLPNIILPRLRVSGIDEEVIEKLTHRNIANRLARFKK